MTNLRKLVCALPPAHKRLLTALLGFLLRVADNVAVRITTPSPAASSGVRFVSSSLIIIVVVV